MTYFERVSESTYRATQHVSGAWRTDEQHIAPMLGLLVHLVETDHHARRDDGLVIGRLSYDILGIIPVEPVDVDIEVLRPGRTIELVQATVAHGGRCAVVLRAWFMQQQDTSALAGTDLPAIPPHQNMIPWDPTQDWPGGFIESLEVRRQQSRPGRAASWVRPKYALLDSEPVSALPRAFQRDDAQGKPGGSRVPEPRPDRPPVPASRRRVGGLRHDGVLRATRDRPDDHHTA